MEAASGGYVEVGRVLLDKGADVNAPPVPSSRDTALTIAADKGHYRFVELLLSRYFQKQIVVVVLVWTMLPSLSVVYNLFSGVLPLMSRTRKATRLCGWLVMVSMLGSLTWCTHFMMKSIIINELFQGLLYVYALFNQRFLIQQYLYANYMDHLILS